jgi:hypothetical protein
LEPGGAPRGVVATQPPSKFEHHLGLGKKFFEIFLTLHKQVIKRYLLYGHNFPGLTRKMIERENKTIRTRSKFIFISIFKELKMIIYKKAFSTFHT